MSTSEAKFLSPNYQNIKIIFQVTSRIVNRAIMTKVFKNTLKLDPKEVQKQEEVEACLAEPVL